MSARLGPVTIVDAAHVRLLPGSPFHDRQQLHRTGQLAALDPDMLLHAYRECARLPEPNGVNSGYAGWDTGFLRGHMLGHYLSAASRMAVATGDLSFEAKVGYLVSELAKCQAALGGGHLAAFPEDVFDWLEGRPVENGGIVVPYYTIHKIMAGLLDAHHYLGNRQALEVVSKMADYFAARLAALPETAIEEMFRTDRVANPQNEFGAMGDAFCQLFALTGQQRYRQAASVFNRSWFVAPLAAGQDHLKGLHANCHIAQALGVAHAANLDGDLAGTRASENFWKLLTGKHAFVTGGNSFHEWLDGPGVEAGPCIDGGVALPATTAESCNAHNMLRLTSLLFVRTPRAEYADYHERALYNQIAASIAPDTGQVTYFTPLHGHFRTYLDGTFCCNGTGLENTPRYNEGISFQQGDSLWINLYVPSEITWDAAGLTIRQEGNAAAGEEVHLTVVKAGHATRATLHLRIPFWISGAPALAVNGVPHAGPLSPSTYVALSREWNTGDVITLGLPASLRLEGAQDVPSMVAIFFGPILLAGQLGDAGMPQDVADRDAYLGLAPVTVPAIASRSDNPADWLRPVAGVPLAFRAHDAGPATGITFRPLYAVHHERYAVYWPLQAMMARP